MHTACLRFFPCPHIRRLNERVDHNSCTGACLQKRRVMVGTTRFTNIEASTRGEREFASAYLDMQKSDPKAGGIALTVFFRYHGLLLSLALH